ncbi:hypothetical protein L3X38_041320 [Prunus dulcis]|uniref:Uncharacterized protein n=1 Tax=Prunus dulcis TaxID=3755 RepID=A0AAD4UUF9_PRUDU|nr:hypothetical protein L3X38_041320 [Prunus dulcis]
MTSHLPLVRIRTDHGSEFDNSQLLKFCEDRNHHVNIDDFAASTEMALDEDDLLSSILEGESPGLDLVVDLSTFSKLVDLSTFSKLVDQSTLDNSVPVDLSTCHNQPQNLSSSVPVENSL